MGGGQTHYATDVYLTHTQHRMNTVNTVYLYNDNKDPRTHTYLITYKQIYSGTPGQQRALY